MEIGFAEAQIDVSEDVGTVEICLEVKQAETAIRRPINAIVHTAPHLDCKLIGELKSWRLT